MQPLPKKKTQSSKGSSEMTRKIMMRKYGLDEGTLYVEQSTMLEPNNFIPSWEAGDEEKKEVSTALRKLRVEYDQIHKKVVEKELALEELKKDVEKAKLEEQAVSKDFGGNNADSELMNHEMDFVQETHAYQDMYQRTYEYMLDRMKRDLISLNLTINDLQESLRSKKQIYNDESSKQMKSREQKLQSKYKLDNLMKNIDHEQKKRQERIMSLQTSIKNKEEALRKRINRVQRQHEIAEAAASDSKDQNEIEKRINFMVQKLWSQFFKRKMEREMQKYAQIEKAFQQIRTTTGNSDVKEMVTKFMTREQTYAGLLNQVGSNEKKYEQLKKENEEKREQLHQLQIENDSKKDLQEIVKENQQLQEDGEGFKKVHEGVGDEDDDAEAEYTKLSHQIYHLQNELDLITGRKKNIQLISDQVQGWTGRVASKLQSQLSEGSDLDMRGTNKTLISVFGGISGIVCDQLNEIVSDHRRRKMEGADSDDFESLNAKEFQHDFGTEELMQKNDRVRPISTMSGGKHDGGDSDYNKSRHNVLFSGEHTEVEDEKFNLDAIHDLNDARRTVKDSKKGFELKKQQELEKAEKIKSKRNK